MKGLFIRSYKSIVIVQSIKMLFDCSAAPPGTASVLHPSSNQFYFAGLWGAIVLSLCKWVKVLELSMQNGNFSFFFKD